MQNSHAARSTPSITASTEFQGPGETTARILVTFIFVINVAFVIYMIAQFFAVKPYSTMLHAAYTATSIAIMLLLGLSTQCFWKRNARFGCYAFFAAVGVSIFGNLLTGLYS